MEQIIKKAIEGGYKYNCSPKGWNPIGDGMTCNFTGANSQWACWNRDDNDSTICVDHTETILDPLFWQSLGKACRWDKQMDQSIVSLNTRSKVYMPIWKIRALSFHEINLNDTFH